MQAPDHEPQVHRAVGRDGFEVVRVLAEVHGAAEPRVDLRIGGEDLLDGTGTTLAPARVPTPHVAGAQAATPGAVPQAVRAIGASVDLVNTLQGGPAALHCLDLDGGRCRPATTSSLCLPDTTSNHICNGKYIPCRDAAGTAGAAHGATVAAPAHSAASEPSDAGAAGIPNANGATAGGAAAAGDAGTAGIAGVAGTVGDDGVDGTAGVCNTAGVAGTTGDDGSAIVGLQRAANLLARGGPGAVADLEGLRAGGEGQGHQGQAQRDRQAALHVAPQALDLVWPAQHCAHLGLQFVGLHAPDSCYAAKPGQLHRAQVHTHRGLLATQPHRAPAADLHEAVVELGGDEAVELAVRRAAALLPDALLLFLDGRLLRKQPLHPLLCRTFRSEGNDLPPVRQGGLQAVAGGGVDAE
mmetsp:Transcript_35117/g.109229  ORF Transcript_35117/g.109229 Transcript_35117/m.109229 type:complete len:411 (+) Transcript_35117:247-1479(+)